MKLALASTHADVQLFTWTPVHGRPKQSATGDGRWTVETDKGSITAAKVVLATNAHTRNFFPEDSLLHSQSVRLARFKAARRTAG